MKYPQPKQKDNGKWIIQVMVDGRRVSRVFERKEDAAEWAMTVKANHAEETKHDNITVERAIETCIQSKSAVLSPSTILNYTYCAKNCFEKIDKINIFRLDQNAIQIWVNDLARTRSPKSVRNAHGLLSSALKMYRPQFVLTTALPQKRPPAISIPSEEEIGKIMRGCVGTKIELPVMLAIWLGLRASEIRGLTWDCVDENGIYIKQAVVVGLNGPEVKAPKSYAGNRYIHAPKEILDIINKQPKKGDFICTMSGQSLDRSFRRLCERVGVGHYRFHDLRHVSASAALALNIPDKYAMQRMGHATNNMLKNVYQHTFKDREDVYAAQMDAWFLSLMQRSQSEGNKADLQLDCNQSAAELQPEFQPKVKK